MESPSGSRSLARTNTSTGAPAVVAAASSAACGGVFVISMVTVAVSAQPRGFSAVYVKVAVPANWGGGVNVSVW
jgi:hypothetical protein